MYHFGLRSSDKHTPETNKHSNTHTYNTHSIPPTKSSNNLYTHTTHTFPTFSAPSHAQNHSSPTISTRPKNATTSHNPTNTPIYQLHAPTLITQTQTTISQRHTQSTSTSQQQKANSPNPHTNSNIHAPANNDTNTPQLPPNHPRKPQSTTTPLPNSITRNSNHSTSPFSHGTPAQAVSKPTSQPCPTSSNSTNRK